MHLQIPYVCQLKLDSGGFHLYEIYTKNCHDFGLGVGVGGHMQVEQILIETEKKT